MAIAEGLWSDDINRLISRIEIRLEQYRLHAESLGVGSVDREGADALVKRVEARLIGLQRMKEKQRN